MKKLILPLIFLSMVAPGSISRAAETTLGALTHSFWRLAASQPAISRPDKFIIWFRDGSFHISSPCRYILATYDLKSDGLHFVGSGSNGGYVEQCKDKDGEADFKTVAGAFAVARHYRLSEDRMVFVDDNGKSTIELAPLQATGLENRRWLITSYAEGGTMTKTTMATDMPPEIILFNGFIDGGPGCGGFVGGGYRSVGEGKYKFSTTWLLAGLCEGRQEDWERQNNMITEDLNAAQTAEGDEYRMTLKDGDGHIVLQLTPEPW